MAGELPPAGAAAANVPALLDEQPPPEQQRTHGARDYLRVLATHRHFRLL